MELTPKEIDVGAFEQESIGRSRTHDGTGRGLTLAHRLVDLMGGSIAVESEKGEGTRVDVRFPLSTSVVQAQVKAGQNE